MEDEYFLSIFAKSESVLICKASFLDENSKQNNFEHGAPPGVISVFHFTLQCLRNNFWYLNLKISYSKLLYPMTKLSCCCKK